MLIKSFIAAAAVAGTALTAATSADAKTKIDVFLDFGTPGYYDAGYGYYDGGYDEGHTYRRHHGVRRISCKQGRREVRQAGFEAVRAIDCEGRTYTYKAEQNGRRFIVTVSARNGDIVGVERIRRRHHSSYSEY